MLKKKIFFRVVPITLLLIVGCGQTPKPNESRSPNGGRQPTDITQIINFINRQKIACDDEYNCQESVAKLVVVDSQSIRYCTAALIDKGTIVTSASCLTRQLQIPNLDCSENVFAIFPQTNIMPQEISYCDKIISSDTNENLEKALWRSDLAFIKLKVGPSRKPIRISKDGISKKDSFKVWKSNYISDTDSTLTTAECKPVFNSYMNPFSVGESSPMIPFEGCHFVEGNSGAIMVNANDELVGIVSGDLDQEIKEYVLASGWLSEKLRPLFHVSNMACAKLPEDRQSDIQSDECYVNISRVTLDKLRFGLMKQKNIHSENIDKIKKIVQNTPNNYFDWSFDFLKGRSGDNYELHMTMPKCISDIEKWIYEFRSWGRIRTYGYRKMNFPHYRLVSSLSGNMTPISAIKKLGEKEYTIEFNPRAAWGIKKTYVKITADFFGVSKESRYEDITDKCNN